MKKVRVLVAAACAATVLGFGTPTSAGEWAPGQDKLTPVKTDGVASSECAFSGRDEPDVDNGGGEPEPDDDLWASTPSGGQVQSPGQLVAAGLAPAGIPGQACKGNLPAEE